VYGGALRQADTPPCEIKQPDVTEDDGGAAGVITTSLTLPGFNTTMIADATAKALFLKELKSTFTIRMNASVGEVEVLNFRVEESSSETQQHPTEFNTTTNPLARFDLSCKTSDAVQKVEELRRSIFAANETESVGELSFFGSMTISDSSLQFSCPAGHVLDTIKSFCVKVCCLVSYALSNDVR
jgi:hypothetical protein